MFNLVVKRVLSYRKVQYLRLCELLLTFLLLFSVELTESITSVKHFSFMFSYRYSCMTSLPPTSEYTSCLSTQSAATC